MAKRLQHRGGTTSQHSTFTGAVREVTVDTDKNTLVVHDGATAGGHPLATATNFTSTGIDDNATSTAITIDSAENVGVGTASPQTQLHIDAGTANDVLRLASTDADANLLIGDSGGSVKLSQTSGTIKFETGGNSSFGAYTEAMRIDSSGNLLVGKTSASSDAPGIELLQNGTIDLQASNSLLAYFNRTGSDGTLVEFHRSGSVRGLISSRSGFIDIGNDDAGLRFEGSNNAINPRNPTTGDNSDNSLDLGKSASRFKDLYLGGGLYVGGTGTANKLDDYEEGTWTPTLNSGTCTVITAKYTKIGNQCTLHFHLSNFSDSSSATDIQITGMPFAQPSNTEDGVGSAYGERTDVNKPIVCMNSNIIRFRNGFGVSNFDTALYYSDINNGADLAIIASVTYETA